MSRYLRCTSCKMVIDTVIGVQVTAGITKQQREAAAFQRAIDEADPFECEACKTINTLMRKTNKGPPDPSMYEKVGSRYDSGVGVGKADEA